MSPPNNIVFDERTTENYIAWPTSDTNPWYYNITLNGTHLRSDNIENPSSTTILINLDDLTPGHYNFTVFVYDQARQMSPDSVLVDVLETIDQNPVDSTSPSESPQPVRGGDLPFVTLQ